MHFTEFFSRVTGFDRPYHYQTRLGEEPLASRLLVIPTGAGKTAAVVSAWLCRLEQGCSDVPRRLVYCLPMRTLVEQTARAARDCVMRSGLDVEIHTLMGGEVDEVWTGQPARPSILVGTQDLILSRMLNRGYAMNPLRWPIALGLISSDALWVFDEIQLFGNGLATSLQLQSFREWMGAYGNCKAIWMSATARPDWLKTVDREPPAPDAVLRLSEKDLDDERLARRLNAVKHIERAPDLCRTPDGLAAFALERHTPGTITIVLVNTARRAREVFAALQGTGGRKKAKGVPPLRDNVRLLHSRFRGHERRQWEEWLTGKDVIFVSTQVIEAGVDLSAALMITDLAPWPSLVQRFGRVNRDGMLESARIYWINPQPPRRPADSLPYEWSDLEKARKKLEGLTSANPASLPEVDEPLEFEHMLRRRDILDLFDTTPDLGGNDLDISRFVRGGNDSDVFIAWRQWEPAQEAPPHDLPRIAHDELCPVPLHEFREFLKNRFAWIWRPAKGEWIRVDKLAPGMRLLLHASEGGYDPQMGWNPASTTPVTNIEPGTNEPEEAMDADPPTFKHYRQTLSAHSSRVAEEMESLLGMVPVNGFAPALRQAARRHDWGKALDAFQHTLHEYAEGPYEQTLAKSCHSIRHKQRPYLRHELASALALLAHGESDLVAYLAAAHHGRIRASIRSMPDESSKRTSGLEDGDILPAAELGDGVRMPEMKISMDAVKIGLSEDGSRSWTDRVMNLRDEIGPFRLAYLEALLRMADEKASAEPGGEKTECPK